VPNEATLGEESIGALQKLVVATHDA